MVQPAFDIGIGDVTHLSGGEQLLIEVSGHSFNYILYSASPYRLHLLRQYRLYTTGDKNTRDVMEEIFADDELLRKYAAGAVVVYNFPEASLVPEGLYNDDIREPVVRLVSGQADGSHIFDEKVGNTGIYNIYSVSKELHAMFCEKLGNRPYTHIYTLFMKWSVAENPDHGPLTRVIFYSDRFIAAMFRNGQLLLTQTFMYQTPEDAAYYLLLMCRQWSVNPSEMRLLVSGLLDTQSALCTELMKYFGNVEYESLPPEYEPNPVLEEFPPHYFSPLLKMSLCV